MTKNEPIFDAPDCCSCCGKNMFRKLYESACLENATQWTIAACANCGLIRTWPQPPDLAPYYAMETGKTYRSKTGRLYSFIKRVSHGFERVRFLPKNLNRPILDLGCGAGDFSAYLRTFGYLKVYASDATTQRPVLLPKDAGYFPFDFDACEFASAPDLRGGFLILRSVLEHVRNPRKLLESLRARGITGVYIYVPNAASLEAKLFRSYWWGYDPPRHLWHFTRETLSQLLQTCGFSLIKTGYMTSPLAFISIYRMMKLHGCPFAELLRPATNLHAIGSALNVFLPNNVCCAVAESKGEVIYPNSMAFTEPAKNMNCFTPFFCKPQVLCTKGKL